MVMAPQIAMKIELSIKPEDFYEAWLSSKTHGQMIGGEALIDAKINGRFEVWDGAITGTTTNLDKKNLIIKQSWRYDYPDWPENKPSQITIKIKPTKGGCEVLFTQSGVPSKYVDEIKKGWSDFYWTPIKKYFANTSVFGK